jgi:acetyl-CoA carboxylase biotin carboxyl carrier protein
MDVDYLQRIVKLMEGHDLNTVELQEGEKRVVLKRGASALPAAPVSFVAPAHVVAPAPPDAPVAPTAAPAPASEEAGLVAIKSPMVGTFYAAPSPDARPFVSVGDPVDEDTDVCVIEA